MLNKKGLYKSNKTAIKRRERPNLTFIPLVAIAVLMFIALIPITHHKERINTRIIRAMDGFPLTLSLEQKHGIIDSAWLRTPAGACKIPDICNMAFIGDHSYTMKVDKDRSDDLMWVLSFMGTDGKGIHLWIGMLTENPKVFMSITPYEHTRWDVLPAKLYVPKDTALYVAPTTPGYFSEKKYSGISSYTFVYTIKMTQNGFTYVPIPKVYEQIKTLFVPGMRGELDKDKRIEYIQMHTDFNGLANGEPPSAKSLLNINMKHLPDINWNK